MSTRADSIIRHQTTKTPEQRAHAQALTLRRAIAKADGYPNDRDGLKAWWWAELSDRQREQLRELVRAAVEACRGARRRLPQSVTWHGVAFPIAATNLGRVMVCSPAGRRVVSSGYEATW